MTNPNTKRETNFAVTLTPCHFKENTYVGRVPRKTVTTDQLLDLVAAHNQGINRYQVGHAMELLKKEILEQAELGFAVDIMEICKLYIAPLTSVETLTPESESVTGFEARFAVNENLKEKLKGVTAAVTAVVYSEPQISWIEDPSPNSTVGVLKSTFSARIKGRKLKVGGPDSGIYFVPAMPDGTCSMDETEWIRVPDEYVTTNTLKKLEFHLPRTLEVGKSYFIAIRTSIRDKVELKKPLTGISKISVRIEE